MVCDTVMQAYLHVGSRLHVADVDCPASGQARGAYFACEALDMHIRTYKYIPIRCEVSVVPVLSPGRPSGCAGITVGK